MLLPHNPNAFTRSPLDRAGERRRDAEWLAAALRADSTQIIPLLQLKPLVIEQSGHTRLGWLNAHALPQLAGGDAPLLFLGLDAAGAAHFAASITDAATLAGLGRFEELRPLAALLSRDEIAIIGPARAVFEWHARNRYCAQCGAATRIVEAGWKRECEGCGGEHFPRVDPVCIMTPTFGDKCFLGRQRAWPRGMHSALAGFIEPGEAIEEAVARETLEEAGLVVRAVRMHSTQPWPFPHSLMIGVLCEVENDNETVDTFELESGRWFTRAEAKLLIAGKHPDAFCPPPFAIAHQLLKTWSEE